MKKYFHCGGLVLTLVLFGTLYLGTTWAQEDLETEITEIEKSLWEGWKNQNGKVCEEHCAENMIQVGRHGISIGKIKILESMSSGCDVKSYSLSDLKVHRFTNDTVIVSYKASQDAVCSGNILPPVVYVATTYVKQGDKWMWACYQETAAAGAESD